MSSEHLQQPQVRISSHTSFTRLGISTTVWLGNFCYLSSGRSVLDFRRHVQDQVQVRRLLQEHALLHRARQGGGSTLALAMQNVVESLHCAEPVKQ